MREYPAGDDALLLDFSGRPDASRTAARVAAALRSASTDGSLSIADAVATAETVLVEAPAGTGLNELGVRRVIHKVLVTSGDAADSESSAETPVTISTVYDGPDIAAAAAAAECTPDELLRAHTAITWRVQFMGFAPGFGYLVPDVTSDKDDIDVLARIGRRRESRPCVAAGAVAIAAGYSAVYPRQSPGGWHLLGRTALSMWDSAATPPARLATGIAVRFVDGGAP